MRLVQGQVGCVVADHTTRAHCGHRRPRPCGGQARVRCDDDHGKDRHRSDRGGTGGLTGVLNYIINSGLGTLDKGYRPKTLPVCGKTGAKRHASATSPSSAHRRARAVCHEHAPGTQAGSRSFQPGAAGLTFVRCAVLAGSGRRGTQLRGCPPFRPMADSSALMPLR